MKICYLFLSLFLLLSCNSKTSTSEKSVDPYIQNIKEQFSDIEIRQFKFPQIEGLYQPNGLVATEDCQWLIVSDYAEKTLFLLDTDGEVIHQTGGGGRGPEEFQSILNPHIGDDGRLYVIDALLFRMSIYEIEDEKLTFIESVPYKNSGNYSFSSLYVTDAGNFGVFQESPNGYRSSENRFYFNRLDENFSIKEQLLEMPGNERQKYVMSDFTFYTPYQYSNKTLWSLDREWFYYTTTGDDTIYRYNVATGEEESLSFLEMEERPNSDAFIEAVEKNHPNSDEESVERLREIETLPLFSAFYVEDQKIFLNILSAPGEDQMILYIDLESEEVKYFETANGFTSQSSCGNHLYGFDFGIDGEVRLMNIEIEKSDDY